jgi:E3 ubiquitin-protein ligase HUWE1
VFKIAKNSEHNIDPPPSPQVPVDADALNAVLRLSLRLTQDFDRAVEFTELGGVKMLLALTQASTFSGFTSLATLLIRHVMEDPATLRYTMEKAIRYVKVEELD